MYWNDYDSEKYGSTASYEDRLDWKRMGTEYSDNSLWGDDGITPMDIRQGALGNCWFMAAASAIAEKPKRLEKIFHNNSGEMNKNGIYAVNLYSLGVKHTVIVDDYLPLESV